jgi:hypothetical protein
MSWPNLHESYGEGERQYDMAKAALDVAEDLAWLGAIGVGGAALHLAPWWVATPLAFATYWLLMRPYRRRLQKAREHWWRDQETYDRWVRSPRS